MSMRFLFVLAIALGSASLTQAGETKTFSATEKGAPAPKTKKAKPVALKSLPPLLREIEDKYTKAATLTADFTQINESAAMQQKKTTTGVIMVKRPNKVRWETHNPDRNILVSDGKVFWFYTPPFDEGERGQVVKRKAAQAQSRLAQALLSGSFSMAKDMKITEKDDSHFVLKPKPGTAGTVVEAQIGVNPEKKVIEQVVLKHKDGNRSEINLSKIELGKTLGDEVFHFTPPPNTDLVTQ